MLRLISDPTVTTENNGTNIVSSKDMDGNPTVTFKEELSAKQPLRSPDDESALKTSVLILTFSPSSSELLNKLTENVPDKAGEDIEALAEEIHRIDYEYTTVNDHNGKITLRQITKDGEQAAGWELSSKYSEENQSQPVNTLDAFEKAAQKLASHFRK
jgi:hypothetical protein